MNKLLYKLRRFLPAISGTTILIIAAFLIVTTGAVQYFYTRNGMQKEVEMRARAELKARNLEIQNVVSDVETAIDNMHWVLEWSVENPDSIYSTLEKIIKNNPIITGCAIAFEPNYFPNEGYWFEPFAGHRDGKVVHQQIGNAEHDYHKMEWYYNGLTSNGGRWTEPYIDDAGSQMMVCSYTMPIHDRRGRVVGVFCSDVSLEWLADLFGQVGNASTFLASRNGRMLACPDKSMVMQATLQDLSGQSTDTMVPKITGAMLAGDSGDAKITRQNGEEGYIYYSPVEGGTGWAMAVYYPYNEIYGGLQSIGKKIFLFQIIGIALLTFIMWHSIRAGRRLSTINAEKESLSKELRIASGIQMGMLPKTFPPYPDLDEVSMHGSIDPAKAVGGDLYDFCIRDKKVFFCIGDVSGKGVPASLVMAVTRSLFRTVSAHTDSPDRIMMQINNSMSEMNESSMFVTLFIGVLELESGRLSYCNAGHCPPVIISNGATPFQVDANIPVGVMTDWSYTCQETTLKPDTRIFLYTDGLTEAENEAHKLFGEQRMIEQLKQTERLTPRGIITTMTTAVEAFVGGAEQSDDLTMLAIHFIKNIKS